MQAAAFAVRLVFFGNGIFLYHANYCGRDNGIHYLGGALARAGKAPEVLAAQLEKLAAKAEEERPPYSKNRPNFFWVE